jgi:hypothetical protein
MGQALPAVQLNHRVSIFAECTSSTALRSVMGQALPAVRFSDHRVSIFAERKDGVKVRLGQCHNHVPGSPCSAVKS